MDDALRERVEALERAVTDGEHDLSAFADDAAAVERLDTLEADVADLARRVEELEAATQALRGYVGNIRSVNTEVEQRADAALAKAETLEGRLPGTAAATDRGQSTADDTPDGGDTATGAGDVGGNDGRAVDEWEWGTGSHTGGTPGVRDEDTSARSRDEDSGVRSRDEDTSARSRDESSRATSAGHGSAPPGHSSAPPGDGSRSPEENDGGTGPAGPAGQAGSTRQQGVGSHRGVAAWGSGGADSSSGHGDTGGDRCESCGRPHAESPENATAGQATAGRASDHASTAPGAPTVTAIAENDPAGPDDDAPVDDGDVLPDGAEDPLVGPGDGDEEPGTLQRIRDLL
jgi:hypothetical protein